STDRRSHAGDNLEFDSGRAQRLRLLTTAAENKGIAALQSHHPLSAAGPLDHQTIDLGLIERPRRARAAADVNQFRVRRRLLEQFGTDERVVKNHLRRGQNLKTAYGDQIRGTWTCADQIDFTAHRESTPPPRAPSFVPPAPRRAGPPRPEAP